MIRTLFIIAGAALVLCLVTVGGAVAIGGQDLQPHQETIIEEARGLLKKKFA